MTQGPQMTQITQMTLGKGTQAGILRPGAVLGR